VDSVLLACAPRRTHANRYTCVDAIRDGVLIDVCEMALQAGIRYPVALTRAVWERCVTVPPAVLFQDEAGRLWDIVWMLACAVRRTPSGKETLPFALHVLNDNREGTPPLVRLKARCGPGDNGAPVITAMEPDDD
jgi:hypothetical protein